MSWNFLQVVEIGATSDGLYPVPSSEGLGFETSDRDTNAMIVQIAGVKVIRAAPDGSWEPSLNVLRTKGRLFVSDHRLTITFDKFVPKDQSSFQPIAAVRPDGSRSRRAKQMLVGHLALTQVRQIGARNADTGKGSRDAINEGLGSLIIAATDATDASARASRDGAAIGTVVAVEIIVAAGVDPNALANDVLSRSMRAKARSASLAISEAVRSAWAEMSRVGFTAPPGEVQTYELDPSEPVRAASTVDVAHPHLIPPTDTSPVPTMLPTPALPMPALDDPPTIAGSAAAALADPPTMAMPLPPLPAPQPDRAVEPSRPRIVLPAPPPPGSVAEWRTDPFARFELRYWDGFGWTEHVHSAGVQGTDPPR